MNLFESPLRHSCPRFSSKFCHCLSLKIQDNLLNKNERITFILCLISEISSGEILLAMARRPFFTSGFLPRKQASWNCLISPWRRLDSPWKSHVAMDFGLSNFCSLSPLSMSLPWSRCGMRGTCKTGGSLTCLAFFSLLARCGELCCWGLALAHCGKQWES